MLFLIFILNKDLYFFYFNFFSHCTKKEEKCLQLKKKENNVYKWKNSCKYVYKHKYVSVGLLYLVTNNKKYINNYYL